MKHAAYIIAFLIAMIFSASAYAGECVVSSEAELIDKIDAAIERGECETDGAFYRERYERFRGGALSFHVIRAKASMDIARTFSCLKGHSGHPLVIIAAPEDQLTFSLGEPLCVDGGDGNVIIDHVTIRSGGIKISSGNNTVIDSYITGGRTTVTGNGNLIISTEVANSIGNGVELGGDRNIIESSFIHDSGENGILIEGYGNRSLKNKITSNGAAGVLVRSCADEACEKIRTAMISRTEFSKNAQGPVSIERFAMPAPVDLVSVSDSTKWTVTGDLELPKAPWSDLNIKAVKIELYIKDGPFIGETDKIDAVTRQFVVNLDKPLKIDGEVYDDPVFTAIAVDYENNNSSQVSGQMDTSKQTDWDNDGLTNEQEDLNNNGSVDLGETDPRNPDTDGDGLSDGEEKLHIGHIAALLAKGIVFADISKLDPTNPDSDGDCLPDGLELGVLVKASSDVSATSAMMSMVGASDTSSLSSYCKAILKQHSLMEAELYDADPDTITDPTGADTDSDGMKDGEEDWNFNGKRDSKEDTKTGRVVMVETDPRNPDTDGDGLLDGAEGDKNKDQSLEDNETDPLLSDTDGDGIPDGVEINQYGTLPNSCDTDLDGLADGLEKGVINPSPARAECTGLQIAGTNFASISVLSPSKTDSDGDGLNDGDEDKNHNGWLDLGETDPTSSDTDGDGIFDYAESKLDIDRDGLIDIDLSLLKNGKKCSPPLSADDVDCDGIPNARDDDSDSDGCPDRVETIYNDDNGDGIPDVWQSEAASCGSTGGGSSGGGSSGGGSSGSGSPSASPSPSGTVFKADSVSSSGADCSLLTSRSASENGSLILLSALLCPLALLIIGRRNYKRSSKTQ